LTFVPSPPHGPRYTSSTTSRPSISPLGSRSSLAPGTHPLRPSAPGCPSAPGVDSDGRFLMIVKPTEHTTLYRSRGRAEILDAEPSSKKANVRNRQHFCNKGYMRATLKKNWKPKQFFVRNEQNQKGERFDCRDSRMRFALCLGSRFVSFQGKLNWNRICLSSQIFTQHDFLLKVLCVVFFLKQLWDF